MDVLFCGVIKGLMFKSILRKKPNIAHDAAHSDLLRCLSAWDLTLFGIGAIIGAGIFVLTGIAAATKAGPSIIFSFVLSGLACGFAALSYAELASSIGGCGSAYNYAYVGLGELPAWIIGWDLLLEYALSVSTVASGWSHYFHSILLSIGWHIPYALLHTPGDGGILNLPALIIVLLVMALLAIGVKMSARFNATMVAIKLLVIAVFIIVAIKHFNPAYWHPFAPFGWKGVMSGAALIFFAYIGFDAVSTTADEVVNPGRDLPIGIIASLVICTLLYIVVSGLLTGMVSYTSLNVSSPISHALLEVGARVIAGLVAVGAIAGLTTVILVMYYGLTRVFLAMARDHLLPKYFEHIHPQTRTPVRIILSTGCVVSIFSALIPISELAELVNIGTLIAFAIVCTGVIILRYMYPNMHRPFKTPLFPVIPILGIFSCLYLTINLPGETWIRFIIWMALGFIVYFAYSRFRSKLNT